MMHKEQPYFFLLGGHDLEMLEIRNILDKEGIAYLDRNLKWGARLSDYRDILSKEGHTLVGVELITDIVPPAGYIEIDHHNNKASLPSSIEQTAELINIQLSDYQKLVAANDRGYIPAMKDLGADEETIFEIRKKDRNAQGVSPEDERQAELSIMNNLHKKGDVTLIFSGTPKFSAITDRRFGMDKKLLVVHESTLCFFGEGVTALTSHFKDLIKDHKAFNGGGDKGFFGIPANAFSEDHLHQHIIPEIIQLVSHGSDE